MLTFSTQEIELPHRIYRWGYTKKTGWWYLVFSVDKNQRRRRIAYAEKIKSEGEVLACLFKK